MKRNRKMVLAAHCILNVNAKVEGLATSPAGELKLIGALMEKGYGIIQLPCAEQDMCGIRRWGQVEEQLNHPHFKSRCEELLMPVLMQVENFLSNGYEVAAVIGLDGSPSCGVNQTCSGEWCGEIGDGYQTQKRIDTLLHKDKPGVMMQVLMELFQKRGIEIPFLAAEEACPERSLTTILEKL